MPLTVFSSRRTLGRPGRALLVSVAVLIPAAAAAQSGTVTGTVTNSATGAPVANVRVALCAEGTDFSPCYDASSNSAGAYSVGLPAGTYFAYTSSSNLINEIFDNIPCPASNCRAPSIVANGTPIVVTAGATVSSRNFALAPGGTITTTVRDAATGAPIASAVVVVATRLPGIGGSSASGFTNAAGFVSLSGLPTATYYAYVLSPTGYAAEIYDNVLCLINCALMLVDSGTAIPVVAGQSSSINVTLSRGGQISGRVTNAASVPLQGVSVAAYARTGSTLSTGGGFTSATTDASGVYTITGLLPGTYHLATSAARSLNVTNEIYDNVPCDGVCSPDLSNAGSPVQLGAGASVAGIDFQLEPAGMVSGTVVDASTMQPLGSLTVSVSRPVGGSLSTVTASTDVSGRYSIGGLSAGSYFLATRSTTHVNEVYDNAPCPGSCPDSDILNGVPVVLAAGAIASGRDFALAQGGSISGVATDSATSTALSSLPVRVYSGSGATAAVARNAVTDASGSWSVSGLPTGTYYASTNSGSLRRANEIYDNIICPTSCSPEAATATGLAIAVTDGTTTGDVNFALGPSAGVPQAPVEFRAHVSASTAHLSWTPPFYGPIPTSYLVEAGLTSGATFVTLPITGNTLSVPGVPPGRYFVRVRAVNAVGLSLPSNEVTLNLGGGGSTAFSAPRDFRAGINDRRLTLTWADPEAEGLPTGYVIEAGSSARLSNIASLPWSSRSFTFEGLPNGVYFIRVRSRRGAQLSPATREVMIVVGNQPSPPDLPRNFSHTLSGATLSLTWQAPLFGTASSYVIEAGTASGLSDIVVFNTDSAAQSATFNNVPSGTYYVRVRAVNGSGESVASDERTIVIP